MLYIFDKDDNFKNIITEDTGLIDTWFKDYQNHLIDEPFVFHVDSESELLPLIVAENQVAFKHTINALQQDVEMLKLMRIKEIDEIYNSDGYIVRVQCEPSWLELYDHFIEDRRVDNGTAQTAMNRALQGSRWVGQVAGEFGNGSTNFYWIDAVEALFKIAEEWGGTLQDYITLDENNEIATRIMYLLPRLGRDNGLLIQPGYNAETIERRTLSYPVTAIWGQGASLEIEDEEGQHTGGYTRYITFEDVEWKKSKGDPVDKPKGQKWIGDPQALAKYGYLKDDGTRMHRFGHFSNQDYETPEELLWATWEALQKEKEPEVYHEAVIDEVDKPIFLGDTGTILDRHYGKPIEVQSQITGLEYDILRPTENVNIVLGNYKDMSRDPLEDEIDEIKKEQSRPPIINDNSFPDVKPGTPVNVEAVGMFRAILVSWEYDSKIYISHYEVYASQTADFVPDAQFLVYRGRVSSFGHEVGSNETWYYRVRAVNTHGTTSEFSVQVSASSTRIDFIDMEDEIKQEIQDTKNRAEEAYGNANIAAGNAAEAIGIAQEGFDKSLEAIDGLTTLYEFKGETTDSIASIKGDVQGLQTTVSKKVDESTFSTFVQQTNNSLAGKISMTDAEGVFVKGATFSATIDGLQTSVSNVKGDLSQVTQLANAHQTKISNMEGDITTLTQTATSLTARIDNIGNRNYLKNSDFSDDMSEWKRTIQSYINYNVRDVSTDFRQAMTPNAQELRIEKSAGEAYLFQDLQSIPKGTEKITVSFYVYQSVQSSGYIRAYLKINDDVFVGSSTQVQQTKGSLIKFTHTYDVSNHDIDEVRLQLNLSDYVGTLWIQAVSLVTGDVPLDWSPSPDDAYSQYSQLQNAINLRVKEDELLTQINLDKSGVLISGKKLVLDGDTTVTGNFRVNSANIASIEAGKITGGTADFAKFNVINMRGLDIYGSRFRSSAGTDYMEITGGNIELSLNNGRKLDISPTGIYGYNQGGSIRFQADSSLVTSAALGTSNDNVYLASNNEARVVNYSSIPGDGNVHSYSYLPIRSLVYRFPDIPNGYFTLLNGGEFRFTGENTTNPVYQNIRASGYFGNFVETRPNANILYLRASNRIRTLGRGNSESYIDLQTGRIQAHSVRNNTETSGTHFYIGTGATSTSELRVTTNGLWGGSHDDTIYTEVRASGYYGNTLDQHSGVGGIHIYVRPSSGGELRVTRTGTTTTYQAVRASAFNPPNSTRDSKKDIKVFSESVLDTFRIANVYNYIYKWEEDTAKSRLGLMLDEAPDEIIADTNDTIDLYSTVGYLWKGVKDLTVITDNHDDELNTLRKQNEELILKVAKLEQRINELECAA